MVFRNPEMLILIVLLPAMEILWRWRRKLLRSEILVLRLIVVSLIVIALADPTPGKEPPPAGPIVLLVDQSDSLTTQGKAALRATADRLAQQLAQTTNDNPQHVVTLWFGDQVVAPDYWGYTAGQEPPASLGEALKPSVSNLEQALRIAREFPGSPGGHIVLLSDGMQNSGDALHEAQKVADAKIRIDTVPFEPVWYPEVRIAGLHVKSSIRLGETYQVQIDIQRLDQPSPEGQAPATPIQATLQLWMSTPDDGSKEELLGQDQVVLQPGYNRFTFPSQATKSGITILRAKVSGVPDTFVQNNAHIATTMVAPSPRVLLVTGSDADAKQFKSAIWPAIESDIIPASRLPSSLADIQGYEGMVLIDVSAYNLALDQLTSIREFVRSEGRGLVVIGGRNSFSLGAYKDTPLEQILPVSLDPPPRPQRSDIALLLMVDHSASMSIPINVSKLDMAKEAAMLSSEMLQSNDKFGLLIFDTRQEWTVPFQTIGDGLTLKQIQDAIAVIDIGGGTDIYGALDEGLHTLMQQRASVRHAVILTDGRSFTNDRVAYQQLIESATEQNITLSTIAIGLDSDTELLNQLAQWGGGRYYFASKPEDIPRLTLHESEIARADPLIVGQFYPELGVSHPLLRGFSIDHLPKLNGYVGTSKRDYAEVILHAPSSNPARADPILAAWQYGLGRVVAWTPSIGAPWASDWAAWDDFGLFWTQVIRYTLPMPDNGPLQIHLTPQQGGVRIAADAFEPGGAPLLADAVARITLPDKSYQDFALHQVAPGRYTQDVLLPIEGAYKIAVLLDRDGKRYYAETGYAHNMSAEYDPYQPYVPAGQSTMSYPQSIALLKEIAQLTGGQVLNPDQVIANKMQPSTDVEELSLLEKLWEIVRSSLWLVLSCIALVIWLVEIALRRRE